MKAASLSLAAVALMVSPLACQRAHLPPSPVPAVLSEREAYLLAEQYLRQTDDSPRVLTGIGPTGDGHLLHYHGLYLPQLRPPITTRLVIVHHDGDVRELHFTEGR
jgi:hypothetical protein